MVETFTDEFSAVWFLVVGLVLQLMVFAFREDENSKDVSAICPIGFNSISFAK